MAYNNSAIQQGRDTADRGRGAFFGGAENTEPTQPFGGYNNKGRIFFTEGELKLCSWLDNVGFDWENNGGAPLSLPHPDEQTGINTGTGTGQASSTSSASTNVLFRLRPGMVESVWFHGKEVKMKILGTSRADVWYLAEEDEYKRAEQFILQHRRKMQTLNLGIGIDIGSGDGDDGEDDDIGGRDFHEAHHANMVNAAVQRIRRTKGFRSQVDTASGKPVPVPDSTAADAAKRLQSDTLRWLRWKPVLQSLEKQLLEHQLSMVR